MLSKLIQWSIENRVMVLILLACLMGVAVWAVFQINIDAIPDLSDVQVIIRTEYPGQSPQIVEDQVTYPLTTALLGVPKAKDIRGYSMVGSSFVYIIFEDGTDIYWARSRVLEQLSVVASQLPSGVTPQLGPDATGVGWVYQYMLVTGRYCPDHPNGLWHDPATDEWFSEPPSGRENLVHHRIFSDPAMTTCPLDGKPLVEPDLDLADLRSLQDWHIRYELTGVDGVSEVAPVGGFVRQYQVVVDPNRLRAYGITLAQVKRQLQRSNLDAGGRLLEMSETEYLVRGRGYLGGLTDAEIREARQQGKDLRRIRADLAVEQIAAIPLSSNEAGTPVYLRDVADVQIGPEIRRGIAEYNGTGETVGGIVVMRFGENASRTIDGVKEKIAELRNTMPPGVDFVSGYDRSDLIDRSVETLSHTLIEEMLIVSLVCVLFLIHARSALVAAVVLPAGVATSVLIMHLLGINANIMSLGGIAIAIGVMVDSSIIMVENAHNHMERERQRRDAGKAPRSRALVIADAAREVGPTLFFSLMIITISFLPVFALQEQSGRLFKPLAFTKTFAMGIAAVLAVTVIPVLMVYLIRERILPKRWPMWTKLAVYGSVIGLPAILLAVAPLPHLDGIRTWLVVGWIVLSGILILPQKIFSEERNPLSRLLIAIYNPFFTFAMQFRWQLIIGSALLVLITIFPLMQLGSEFMPPLEEGDFLYMPNADPGLSITKAKELLQQTDRLIYQFPEVVSVMGKIGRSETATDPAPLTMIETTIMLERDKSKWRQMPTDGFLGLFPGSRPITLEELVDGYNMSDGKHVPGINDALNIPGLTGALTRGSMPIKTRIDMLATGIRTAVGIKVMGDDLAEITNVSEEIAQVLQTDENIRKYTASAYSDKLTGGNYVDINIDRAAAARYGLIVADVQDVIMSALGGATVTWTVEGRERYPVNIRYPRELRDDLPGLRATLVNTPHGAQVPLEQLADIGIVKGPPMIKSENARLTSWVFVDVRDLDLGTYVNQARDAIAANVELPTGVTLVWSGQWEYMQSANRTLMLIVPIVLVAIMLLLYMSTKSWFRTILIMVTLSFSVVGAVWMLYFLGYNMSVAVWVGIIALVGLDAETSQVMLLFIDNSVARFRAEGKLRNRRELWFAIHDGAVQRIRPKTMTVVTTFAALMPLMFASGAGADTMRRLAAPMIGGLFTSFTLELLIYPAIMYIYYSFQMRRGALEADEPQHLAAA